MYYFYEQTAQLGSAAYPLIQKCQPLLQLLPTHFWARYIAWAHAKTQNRGKHSSGRKHSFMKYFLLGVKNYLLS